MGEEELSQKVAQVGQGVGGGVGRRAGAWAAPIRTGMAGEGAAVRERRACPFSPATACPAPSRRPLFVAPPTYPRACPAPGQHNHVLVAGALHNALANPPVHLRAVTTRLDTVQPADEGGRGDAFWDALVAEIGLTASQVGLGGLGPGGQVEERAGGGGG
jgi:hypothetical protein